MTAAGLAPRRTEDSVVRAMRTPTAEASDDAVDAPSGEDDGATG